jgi:hypothetical protein
MKSETTKKLPLEGQNLGLLLQHINQTTVLSAEKLILSTSEESEASQVEHEQHVSDHFKQ